VIGRASGIKILWVARLSLLSLAGLCRWLHTC